MNLKYGIWNLAPQVPENVQSLVRSGYPPLAAMVLSARGIGTAAQARQYLSTTEPFPDPFLMTDMDKAAARVSLALAKGETIAVFGDYDVDGITATCLLTDFLQTMGGRCISYIPGRLEEGYGLNPIAIHSLHAQGVELIVTVDCGITAVAEAQLCRELGIDLVITDHHACKDKLPQAVAVVDPHRPGDRYPHRDLSGVGVAYKLISAILCNQNTALDEYADLVCLGTVADVMPLHGENRRFVARGLESMRHTRRPGLAALMAEAGCDQADLTAANVGFMLAPRINAAGRMGQIGVALELFLTRDPQRARLLAQQLCQMNTQRQAVESEIYAQAIAMLPQGQPPAAIVLADEGWHQGVVGIVASRIAEEYCCPTVLICLDGEHGKASSRSYGGFNLFTALTALNPLLESYGGHELAAGFTIARQQIPEFRASLGRLVEAYTQDGAPLSTLQVDCKIDPELFTLPNVDSLQVLEPCGSGCPKPVLAMERLTVEQMQSVGSGRHLRLRLRRGNWLMNGIYFSVHGDCDDLKVGDLVDVAFTPQVNTYRGQRQVQMNIQDVRPTCAARCRMDVSPYRLLRRQDLSAEAAAYLLLERRIQGAIWRYIAAQGALRDTPACLCRKIVRQSGAPLDLSQLLAWLDIFSEVGLLELTRQNKYICLRTLPSAGKADLNESETMRAILRAKER